MRRKMKKKLETQTKPTLKSIQRRLFKAQLILIVTLAVFLGIAGIFINFIFEQERRDQNLQNVAETIAHSPILDGNDEDSMILREYLDSLLDSLGDIDVISVVNSENVRIYHSNHELIHSVYDGTIPEFESGVKEYYAANDRGPSGNQRRAYAAIYDKDGQYRGFVMAIMLMENIREQTVQTLFIFLLITLVAVLMELMISDELSGKIRQSLLGYEPDVFTAMYQVRDNILESLNEGIIAINAEGKVQFVNQSALTMLHAEAVQCHTAGKKEEDNWNEAVFTGQSLENFPNGSWLQLALKGAERELNIQGKLGKADVLLDRIPIKEENKVIGAVGILHNRTEYTKLMEDLTGTRYLVDSMRANNHDFTNKLHVILGLIQMEMYDEAVSYIENITIVQRATISRIMKAVNEPAVAALLIGKTARASELNIKFTLREGCYYSKSEMHLPAETLVTIIGNLIDNAFEAMDGTGEGLDGQRELLFGIYSKPGALLITVDDTGIGISRENMERIFINGFSTKGEGRGTGLYQVKKMVETLGGRITVESQETIGTSVSISFTE